MHFQSAHRQKEAFKIDILKTGIFYNKDVTIVNVREW